jgi:predicted ATPase
MNILHISNFKCFNDISISLNQLTVMAGANGNGKSTAIQALLFLRKTIEENIKILDNEYVFDTSKIINTNVALNKGYLLSLGNSGYVTNRHSGKSKISLSVSDYKGKVSIDYEADNTENQLYVLATHGTNDAEHTTPLLNRAFYYLNAERIGPRVNQSVSFYDYPNAGYQGEFVAQLISDVNYTSSVIEERRYPKVKNPRLEAQVNAWLDDLMPGVRVIAKQSLETLTSQIQVENHYIKGDPTIATNIGFGISYALPIIVSGLVAIKNSYLIVENPEAHLHPSAQSKIGRFLAMVAASGVNVILETHSDHVLNGIQIAVAKQEVEAKDVTINFFSQDDTSLQPKIDNISVSEKGDLSSWPKGFFDQSQIDYAELFKLKRL